MVNLAIALAFARFSIAEKFYNPTRLMNKLLAHDTHTHTYARVMRNLLQRATKENPMHAVFSESGV